MMPIIGLVPTGTERMLTGIYTLPAIKCTFFIVSVFDDDSNKQSLSQGYEKRKQYLEHILKSKDSKIPNTSQLWQYILVDQQVFLSLLEKYMPSKLKESIYPYVHPENLDMLAMNILETSFDHKILRRIDEKDMIEVFI